MSDGYVFLVVVFFCAALLAPWVLWSRTRSSLDRTQKELETTQESLKKLTERFQSVIDLDAEVETVRATCDRIQNEVVDLLGGFDDEVKKAHTTHNQIRKKIADLRASCTKKQEVREMW